MNILFLHSVNNLLVKNSAHTEHHFEVLSGI